MTVTTPTMSIVTMMVMVMVVMVVVMVMTSTVVMMITAYGDAENHKLARELGADDFLTKPVDFTLLKERLKLSS